MREKSRKKLVYFEDGLMAAQRAEANLLKGWYFVQSVNGVIGYYFEEINLHRSKIIRDHKKVRNSMREKNREPFIFFACKN